MPDGDLLRATLDGVFDGEPVMIDLGFIAGAGAADFVEDANNLNAAITTALGLLSTPSPFMAPLAAAYSLNYIRIQDLAPGVAAQLAFGIGVSGGNVTDDALPPQLALCVTWRTGLKGCLLYTSPSPRDRQKSRMPSSA